MVAEPRHFQNHSNEPMMSWDADIWTLEPGSYPTLKCLPSPEATVNVGGPYSGKLNEPIYLKEVNSTAAGRYLWTINNEMCRFNKKKVLRPRLTCSDISRLPTTVMACITVKFDHRPTVRECATVTITKAKVIPDQLKTVNKVRKRLNRIIFAIREIPTLKKPWNVVRKARLAKTCVTKQPLTLKSFEMAKKQLNALTSQIEKKVRSKQMTAEDQDTIVAIVNETQGLLDRLRKSLK